MRESIFERFGRRFEEQLIAAVDSLFLDESIDFNVKDALVPQLDEAIEVAGNHRDGRIAEWLHHLYFYCTFRGHHTSYLRLTEIVEQISGENQSVLAVALGNRALILQDRGQLDEALELHRKEQAIYEALGDRAGLARTWWNQGILHGVQGRIEVQIQLWKRSIETNRSIGIPTVGYEKALQELLGMEDQDPPANS